jgi:hypothetical protein
MHEPPLSERLSGDMSGALVGRSVNVCAIEGQSACVASRSIGMAMTEFMRLAHQIGAAVSLLALTLWLQ